jgi:hypothetical protein
MDPGAVRDAFDAKVRRHPAIVAPGEHVERDDRVVRLICEGDEWTGVTWCDLDEASADGVIASQIERFAELSRAWEWKHYSYDRPADLADRLRAAGVTPEPREALLVGETADLPTAVPPPPGVVIVPVADEQGVASFIWVNDEVFGGDNAWVGKVLLADMALRPRMTRAMLAMAGNTPIAALRVEFSLETDFAFSVERLHIACMAQPRCVSLAVGRLRRPIGRQWLSLPPGRRLPRQRTYPQAPGLRRTRHRYRRSACLSLVGGPNSTWAS